VRPRKFDVGFIELDNDRKSTEEPDVWCMPN
jgi:hypothetical protein